MKEIEEPREEAENQEKQPYQLTSKERGDTLSKGEDNLIWKVQLIGDCQIGSNPLKPEERMNKT